MKTAYEHGLEKVANRLTRYILENGSDIKGVNGATHRLDTLRDSNYLRSASRYNRGLNRGSYNMLRQDGMSRRDALNAVRNKSIFPLGISPSLIRGPRLSSIKVMDSLRDDPGGLNTLFFVNSKDMSKELSEHSLPVKPMMEARPLALRHEIDEIRASRYVAKNKLFDRRLRRLTEAVQRAPEFEPGVPPSEFHSSSHTPYTSLFSHMHPMVLQREANNLMFLGNDVKDAFIKFRNKPLDFHYVRRAVNPRNPGIKEFKPWLDQWRNKTPTEYSVADSLLTRGVIPDSMLP